MVSNSSVRVGWSGGWRLPGSGQGQPPVWVQPAEGERHEDKKERAVSTIVRRFMAVLLTDPRREGRVPERWYRSETWRDGVAGPGRGETRTGDGGRSQSAFRGGHAAGAAESMATAVTRRGRRHCIGPDPLGRDVSIRTLLIIMLSSRQGFCLAGAAASSGPASAFPWI